MKVFIWESPSGLYGLTGDENFGVLLNDSDSWTFLRTTELGPGDKFGETSAEEVIREIRSTGKFIQKIKVWTGTFE